jgi:hypothetical protein
VIIFHPYVPGHREGDQRACIEGLEDQRIIGRRTIIDVEISGVDVLDYAKALDKALLEQTDLLVVEQDMAFSDEQVAELEECKHPLCVFAYYVGNTREGRIAPELAHRYLADGTEVPIPNGARLADRVSLGFARMKPEAFKGVIATPVVPRVHYRDLAWCLSVRLAQPWHVHWPAMAHHHYES